MLVPLPIGAKPYYNIDDVASGNFADTCTDGYIDEANTVKRRGGLKPAFDVGNGAPGLGLFYWVQQDILIARNGTQAFKIERDGTITEITGVSFNGNKTKFADGNKIDGSPWLYMFDGGYPVYSLDGLTATRLTSASGSPSAVKFGCWNTGRFLIASDATRKMYATDTNPATGVIENDYFLSGSNPLTAEHRPDNLDYLGSSWEEIQAWGKQGMETWRPDDVFFSPVTGTFSPVGILAPYSVVEADNTLFALCLVDNGQKRAAIRMQGRTPQVISLPIEKLLRSYGTIDDAIGWLTDNSEYVLTFPTEGVTWCYDYRINAWYQWSKWDQVQGVRQEFLGRFSAVAWGKCYMQSRLDGKIYQYDRDTFTDDGGIIATEYRTDWITRPKRTRCNFLRFLLKRAQGGISGNEPVMLVKWRDDGSKIWSNPRKISLGKQGESEFFVEIEGLDIYRSRQYSFTLTDDADLALVSVWEDATECTR